jgi:hypothetical protein
MALKDSLREFFWSSSTESILEQESPPGKESVSLLGSTPAEGSALDLDGNPAELLQKSVFAKGTAYTRFQKQTENLREFIPDSIQRARAAVKTLVSEGLTREQMINALLEHQKVLAEAKTTFDQVIKNQTEILTGQRKIEEQALASLIQDKQHQIADLQHEIEVLQGQRKAKQEEIDGEIKKVQKVTDGFSTAYAEVSEQFAIDQQTLSTL